MVEIGTVQSLNRFLLPLILCQQLPLLLLPRTRCVENAKLTKTEIN